jgi:hypothetical protein
MLARIRDYSVACAVVSKLCLTPLLLVLGCGGAMSAASSTSVGALSGSDARLGIVRSGEKIVAYVCGGPKTYTTHSRWFSGQVSSRSVSLEKDGWTLAIDLYDEAALGTLTAPEGTDSLTFETAPHVAGTIAGIYGALDRGCRTGVVVTQSSSSDPPSYQGTWCDSSGHVEQVEPGASMPSMGDGSGFEVVVQRPDGRATLFVEPVSP